MSENFEKNILEKSTTYLLIISGIYMIGMSFYFLGSYLEVLYPLGFKSLDVFTQTQEINSVYTLRTFLKVPFHVYSLFFGISLISLSLIDKDEVKILYPIIIILNLLYNLPFFLLPTFKAGVFSLFHLIYFIFSVLLVITINKQHFKIPKNLYFIIFPIIFFATNSTVEKVIITRSNSQSIKSIKIRDDIKATRSKIIPQKPHQKWISKKHDNSFIKISVFGDFSCSYCNKLNKDIEMIRKKYGRISSIQYFAFPTSRTCNPLYRNEQDENGELACLLGKFALCSNDSVFPATYKLLTEGIEKLNIESIKHRAEILGYHICMRFKQGNDLLSEDLEAAKSLNITKPTIFINGIKVPEPYQEGKVREYFMEIRNRLGI